MKKSLRATSSVPPRPFFSRTVRLVCALTTALCLAACAKPAAAPSSDLEQLRHDAAGSDDPILSADWLLSELLRPGGSAEQAKRARRHLDEVNERTMTTELARGMDDFLHGRIRSASEEFFGALLHARTSKDPRASLVAWYAALHTQDLSRHVHDFGKKHQTDVELLLRDPGRIGFRAYAVVVDLWARQAFARAESDVDDRLAARLGCVQEVGLAGPFGEGVGSDILRSFPAEAAGPWPRSWPGSPGRPDPRQLEVERTGCDVEPTDAKGTGVFYAQSFLELDRDEDLILSASGATAIWVDDTLVLERDVRTWGVWPRFGVRLGLAAGRHRVLWKVGDGGTALRVVRPDGRAWTGRSSADGSISYAFQAPKVLADPNAIMAYIRPSGVRDPGDDLTRYLAAFLAEREGQPDVATVLFEPLVKDPATATGVCLITAGGFAEGDPIYDQSQTRELVHELEVRATERDPGLWYPRLRGALWEAEQRGPVEAVTTLAKLVNEFPEVAALHNALARTYEQLGWTPELERTIERLIVQFPDDTGAIALGIDLFEGRGDAAGVERLLGRLRELDPDSEVVLERAIARRDYTTALAELKRLAKRRPSREDLALRIEDVMVRAGNDEHAWKRLEEAITREPRDVHARLALADAAVVRGEKGALAKALVDAVEAGADPSVIEEAIDLVEGVTELEPYRLDARGVIADFEASKKEHPGTAVRVLDYGAVLIRSDGSSRFLEHEIVRVQSEEGIKRFTEMDTGGHILHLRVIKKDGRVLEPEAVEGKPTATMPHLEIGDYVEQERIISRWGEGESAEYEGPAWFFREEDVAYARSEFVVIAPANKPLQLEKANGVPEPTTVRRGLQVSHHFRVDDSPAAPAEPGSPPAQEFLPRVSVGWGLSFDKRIERTSRGLMQLTPVDPRIRRIAQNIVRKSSQPADKATATSEKAPASSASAPASTGPAAPGKDEEQLRQARALYHWVLDSVQEGEETDGRRVVVSRSGNRWRGFVTLAEALGIPVRWALAESRISSPVLGEIGSANRALAPVLFVGAGPSATWLTIEDKFAPYGTVPGHLRGEKAYLLGGLEAEVTEVPRAGTLDRIGYQGTGTLRPDGSARLVLNIVFSGQYAAGLRNGLSQIPEGQLETIIESQLLGQKLPGAELVSYEVVDQDKLDRALVLKVVVEAPQFATPTSGALLLGPPFMPRLTGLTRLAERKTPLLITDTTAQGLDLKLTLPSGTRAIVRKSSARHPRSRFEVQDQAGPGYVHLIRDVVTDAGRVQPSDYGAFQTYARDADAALTSAIRISG
jgi:tetratricopeptide (TPR) repeat protein